MDATAVSAAHPSRLAQRCKRTAGLAPQDDVCATQPKAITVYLAASPNLGRMISTMRSAEVPGGKKPR